MEIPPFEDLPVKFNHWGEPLQFDFGGLIEQGALLRGLQAYGWHRERPGGFLQAALANDFRSACGMADFDSRRLITQVAAYIHNHLPGECSGSRAAVEAWLAPKDAGVEAQLFGADAKEGWPQS